MKINAADIPPGGLSLDVEEEGKTLSDLAGGLDFSILSPVKAHFFINALDENLQVEGSLRARLSIGCSRCLKDFEKTVETAFSLFFAAAEAEGGREKELKREDMEINYLEGGAIDTTEIILGQLSLEVPMQPLCTPECKGLCPKCGADLNSGECDCREKWKIDPRFAKLRDIKIK